MNFTPRRLISLVVLLGSALAGAGADLQWQHFSTTKGDLPKPGEAQEQTAAAVLDFDLDGRNDFVVTTRKIAPAVIGYRRTETTWERYVIEPEMLRVEAGGAVCDIDGDGDPDVLFGGDGQSDEMWWWENPYPKFDPAVPWVRHQIKKGGGKQHHDQAIADFLGNGKLQLAFWNQRAKKLFLADIPANPRTATEWPLTELLSESAGLPAGFDFKFGEGMAVADIDGDGQLDLLAGNLWFKHRGGKKFEATCFSPVGGRVAAGNFKPGKRPQIVVGSADWVGPLRLYECRGDPFNPKDWSGRDLLDREMVHGHSLQVADIDGDGNLDIFAAEMAKWLPGKEPNNAGATAWIFYGDGQGNFRKTVFQTGVGFHEAKVADLNGDGRMDILGKPYTWEAPRIDVWLQRPPAGASQRYSATATGLELYSFAREFNQDFPGTLKMVQALGVTDIEVSGLHGRTAAEFRAALDQAGLRCTSMIANYEELATKLDVVIANAKALGASYVVCGLVPHKRVPAGGFNAELADKAARDFNAWGERLTAAGLQFCYHPHGYEFLPGGNGTLMDRIADNTDPRHVKFELDVFWVLYPGHDPLALLRKYAARTPLMHLKDMRKGIQGDQSGKASLAASVALGQGQADWPALLNAAAEIGVRHFYIEDESGEAVKLVPESLRYLAQTFPTPQQ